MASNTVASSSMDQTSRPLTARMSLTVFMGDLLIFTSKQQPEQIYTTNSLFSERGSGGVFQILYLHPLNDSINVFGNHPGKSGRIEYELSKMRGRNAR